MDSESVEIRHPRPCLESDDAYGPLSPDHGPAINASDRTSSGTSAAANRGWRPHPHPDEQNAMRIFDRISPWMFSADAAGGAGARPDHPISGNCCELP